jgi:uncharacterized protein
MPLPVSPTRLLALTLALVGCTLVGCKKSGAAPVAPTAAGCETPWPQQLDHASTPETHRRAVDDLLVVLHLELQLQTTLDLFLRNQIQANPGIARFEGVMRTFLGKYLSLDALRDPMIRMYMERFTELEIVQIAAFYRTPLGQRTVAEVPRMMEEGSVIGRRLVEEHMPELQEMIRAQLEREGGAAPAPEAR